MEVLGGMATFLHVNVVGATGSVFEGDASDRNMCVASLGFLQNSEKVVGHVRQVLEDQKMSVCVTLCESHLSSLVKNISHSEIN